MSKTELIDRLAKDAKITKKAAETALRSFVACVRDSLKKGKAVTLGNGRNPQTGAAIKIKASKVVKFRAGKALKDAVR